MKTEPIEHITLEDATEMAQKTDYACFAIEEPGNEINWADAGSFYLEGFNAGYEKCQSNLKIKQLEWEEYRDCLVSTTPFYNVSIKEVCGIYELATAYSAFIKSYNSLDEAKAAAQDDFEKRVKECL